MTTSATPTLTQLEQLEGQAREDAMSKLTPEQIAQIKSKGGFRLMKCHGLSVDTPSAGTSEALAALKRDTIASKKMPGGYHKVHGFPVDANGNTAAGLAHLRQQLGEGDAKPVVIPDSPDQQ